VELPGKTITENPPTEKQAHRNDRCACAEANMYLLF